jgi:hypothetical protein
LRVFVRAILPPPGSQASRTRPGDFFGRTGSHSSARHSRRKRTPCSMSRNRSA